MNPIKNIMSLFGRREPDRWEQLSTAGPNEPDKPDPLPVRDVALPHSAEAEAALLGSMMLMWGEPVRRVAELASARFGTQLTRRDFYIERHRLVWDAMLELDRRDVPIDVVTVSDQLRDAGCAVEMEYLERLLVSVPAVGHLGYYVQVVREMALLRGLLAATYALEREHEHRRGEA